MNKKNAEYQDEKMFKVIRERENYHKKKMRKEENIFHLEENVRKEEVQPTLKRNEGKLNFDEKKSSNISY